MFKALGWIILVFIIVSAFAHYIALPAMEAWANQTLATSTR